MKTACFGLGFAAGLARLRRAPGSAQPPVPEQPHPREAAAPGSVCIHIHLPSLCVSAPGGAAFRASPKPQPFLALSRCRACSLPRRRAGDVGTQERELPPPGCRAGRCSGVPPPEPFPLCTAGQWEAHGKAHGRARPVTHSTLAPAAWSGLQLLAYQVASASLLAPLRGVDFGLETPDLQVWRVTNPPEQWRKGLRRTWKPLREVGSSTELMLVSNQALSHFTHREAKAKAKACQGPVKGYHSQTTMLW